MVTEIHHESTVDGCEWKIFRQELFDDIRYEVCGINGFTLYPSLMKFRSEDLDPARWRGLSMSRWMSVDELDKAAITKAKSNIGHGWLLIESKK